ncbi:MAG TPA: GAF domain-containing sensor histidine kinase [Anaerolineales bacterium]|nr:GAF domain-containing sensor histidine kinase [Anaerolineales bacterium]
MQAPTIPGNVDSAGAPPERPGRSLVEAELASSVAWLIRLRWAAGVSVIVATWLVEAVFRLDAAARPLYAIGGAILVYNLAFYLLERRLAGTKSPAADYQRLAMWQVGLDWLAMILLIHFTGGIESPVILFFIFHIVIASIFFSPRAALAFAVLAIALVSGIALLEYIGLLPHEPIEGYLEIPLYRNGLYLAAVLFFFASTGLISAYLGSSIQERLRKREAEIVSLTESLQQATTRLQALNDSARIVGSTLDVPQVLNRLVRTSAEAMGVRACSIRLLDTSGHRLEPVAVYGLSQAYLEKGPVDPVSNPLAREVLSGKTVNVADAAASPLLQYPGEASQEGIRSMLSAPLIGKDGAFGILRAYAIEPDRFTPEDEAFLAAIAAQGSIAIENAMAYQAIEQLDATKSQFIRMVTHELRSPVSVTKSLLKTLTNGYVGKVTDAQQDILNRANRRIDFLQKLVDDLLDLATGKVEGKLKDVREPVDLAAILNRVADRFEVSAREHGLQLDYKSAQEGAFIILATEEGLDRVFDNLISNAVKYTRPGGSIWVAVQREDNEAWVTVKDTGIGIPQEAMQHMFEEFYRAPNAKELEFEGTGLGLTIVKDLITRFGGRIAIESEQDAGTTVTLTLPLIATDTRPIPPAEQAA